MYAMSKREGILEAAEELLWERGYESSSPRMILRQSGAGQGSLYHHFKGKKELAIAAMERHEAVLTASARELLDDDSVEPLERVRRWLEAPRDPVRGCRLGRLAHERSVRDDADLRRPLDRYLRWLHRRLAELLQSAAAARGGRVEPPPQELASMLVAVIQGGFVLSQGTADSEHVVRAQRAAAVLLGRAFRTASVERPVDVE